FSMASLGVHYVKSRQECKDCHRKEMGLVGIASKCLGIEVHAGATHKFYHPKCFFEGSKCQDVIDKLHYKTAEGMTGYKALTHSDQMMIYSLFANATDDGVDDSEEERIEKRRKAAAEKRAKKREEAAEKQKTSKHEEDKDQPEVPKKRRRTEKKENKKIVVESDEDEVIPPKRSNRRQEKEKKEIKNVSSSKTRTAEDSGFMDEELEDVDVSKDNSKFKDQKVQQSPSEKKMDNEEDEVPMNKQRKVPGRGKPSDKLVAMFEKVFKRKIDEEVDMDLDSD
ncbi:hypothetical protein PRIPAC_89614, partial [Pristionchus pacificus]